MKKIAFALMAILLLTAATTKSKTESLEPSGQKVILITLDGYRWQELFGGADSTIINNKKFGNVKIMKDDFWAESPTERRAKLMPFTWDYIAKNGVMIGNRWEGCEMDVSNKMWFSYPGYNEDLCGFADDDHVHSNNPIPNNNVSVLEVANKSEQYKDSVLAFGSWARFIEILNEKRSGLEVNANYRPSMSKNPTENELYINKLQERCPKLWEEERFDFITHEYALEAMKSRHPKLLYIGYGDTDEWAHAGNYRLYLNAAHYTDDFIREIWEYIQSDPFYKDQTTVIISCDHGRGDTTETAWCSHSFNTPHSGQTWLMAFGKGIPAKGVLTKGEYYNCQIAPTVAKLLGLEFKPEHKGAGKPINF